MERDTENKGYTVTFGERVMLKLKTNFVTDEDAPALLAIARRRINELEPILASSRGVVLTPNLQSQHDLLSTGVELLRGVVDYIAPDFDSGMGLEELEAFANNPNNSTEL